MFFIQCACRVVLRIGGIRKEKIMEKTDAIVTIFAFILIAYLLTGIFNCEMKLREIRAKCIIESSGNTEKCRSIY